MMTDARHRDLAESGTSDDGAGMLGLYRARSAHYDEELAPFEPLRTAAIERLQLREGDTVLDVGCGTGLSFAPLLARMGPHGKLIGIEQCPDMLGRARDRLSRPQARQVRLVQASADQARWQGPPADAAILHFTHDIVRSKAALDNIFSHLRPGARVVATGLQWAPPWMWPVNLFVTGAALYSVKSLEGLTDPWTLLADYVDNLEVTSEWMGSIYIASGKARERDTR